MQLTRGVKVVLALVALVALAGSFSTAARIPSGPVKHYVVLMMENRAYDHLLGYFQIPGARLEGLSGDEFNRFDPSDSNSRKVSVSPTAKDISPDPDHSVNGTTWQIFGTPFPTPGMPAKMNGFVANSKTALGEDIAPRIMECWNPESLPIITTLAKNYAIFDQWHASIPGPTYGNRMFFHAATSHGVCWNTVPTDGFQIKTIYQLLDEAGYDWAFYFDQAQDASFFNYTRQPRFHDRMRTLDQFKVDSENGNLPTLSFMLPRFFSTKDRMGDDQHPSHAVSHGESLIKRVYEELRASPSWESSAFLLTYDEHGGFYDHVPTPLHGVPNPDGRNCRNPVFFDYKRLGLRIPTILISPWVDHAVVHEPQGFMPHSTSKFEHSSFIATLTRILKLNGPLTKRDAWAAPFDYLFSRATPRTDCPLTLPPIAHPLVAEYKKAKQHQPEHLQPLHDLHISYLQATNSMVGLPRDHNIANLKTEHDAAMYIERITAEWKHKSKLAESM